MRATVVKSKKGLPTRVWEFAINKPDTKNIQLALDKIDLFKLFENAITDAVTPGSASTHELLKTLLVHKALFSNTAQNHAALVGNIVLTLKTDYGISISVSLLVSLLLHQLKDYANSPQGEVFAKVLKDIKKNHPRDVDDPYTQDHLTAIHDLTNKADDGRRQSRYNKTVDVEWEETENCSPDATEEALLAQVANMPKKARRGLLRQYRVADFSDSDSNSSSAISAMQEAMNVMNFKVKLLKGKEGVEGTQPHPSLESESCPKCQELRLLHRHG